MTWALIFVVAAIGFSEYCCAHFFLRRAFGIGDNRAHLVLGGLVLLVLLLPLKLIWSAFMVTLFFTPLVLWLSIKFSRSR